VAFSGYSDEKPSINEFVDAASQNHSIHTIDLLHIDCLAQVLLS